MGIRKMSAKNIKFFYITHIIPFFFFAMIVLLVKNRNELKGTEKALIGISIPLDLFIGLYTPALYVTRF